MANNNDKFISRENAKTLWGYMIDLLTGKQNKLTFDDTPTQSSDNPVKSGGIFTALAGKGTYSKPQNGIPKTDLENAVQTSLGLADSALQSETDPTVPSWAKQTNKPSYTQDEVGDGSTYKRVTQTEKDTWSGKQNALSTAQMNAVNSGITTAGVAQISTNQTNILYGIKTGAKNQLKLTGNVWNPNTLYVYWDYKNGTVRVVGSIATTSTVFINLGSWTAPEDNVYRLYANGLACTANIRIYDDVSWTTYAATSSESNEATWTKGTTRQLYLRIASGVVVGDITVTPMICQKSIFDADPSFAPYAAQNHDLTVLEEEDRAALVELVDSGAKNLTDFINGARTDYHATTSVSSGVLTATATGTYARTYQQVTVSKAGNYVVKCKITNRNIVKGSAKIVISPNANGTSAIAEKIITANGEVEIEFTTSTTSFYIHVYVSWDEYDATNTMSVSEFLFCTKAEFYISPKVVPYRMPYGQALTLLNQKAPSGVADYVASGSADNLPSGCALCNSNVTNMPALTGNYFIIRTRIYDANCAEQEAVAPAGNRRFNRTKWGGTWTAWEEYTKS